MHAVTDVFDESNVWVTLTLDGNRWETTGGDTSSGKLKKDGTTLKASASKSADGQRLVFDKGFAGLTGEVVFYSTKADARK